jgi:hypothetical protein
MANFLTAKPSFIHESFTKTWIFIRFDELRYKQDAEILNTSRLFARKLYRPTCSFRKFVVIVAND